MTIIDAQSLEVILCPLCGSARYHYERSGPDYFMHVPGMFHLARCEQCGLLYQNPRPPLVEIGRYYPDHYGSYGSAQAGLRSRQGLLGWVIRRGQHKRCRLLDCNVPPKPDRPRRLLDVGCASGLFL